ncbi:MAG: methyltransferase domain-containing protein [Saprospiraceae bacterium]
MLNTENTFQFKQFTIHQDKCGMKVNTDGVLLGVWSDVVSKVKILDIGTGTGVIALILAQKKPEAMITGIDIDENACLQAYENFRESPFKDRLECTCSSIQDFAIQSEQTFDLIISNPPFFSGGTFSLNENKANVRHTIKLPHSDLLRSVKRLLKPDGHFDLILPYIEGLKFIEMARSYDLYLQTQTNVISKPKNGIERLLLRFGNIPREKQENTLLIQEEHHKVNEYTDAYTQMVQPFYPFLP